MSQAISLETLKSTPISSKAFPNLQKAAIATSIIGAVVLGAFLGLGIHEALTHGSMLPIQATMIGVGGGLTIIAGAIAYRLSKTFTPHQTPSLAGHQLPASAASQVGPQPTPAPLPPQVMPAAAAAGGDDASRASAETHPTATHPTAPPQKAADPAAVTPPSSSRPSTPAAAAAATTESERDTAEPEADPQLLAVEDPSTPTAAATEDDDDASRASTETLAAPPQKAADPAAVTPPPPPRPPTPAAAAAAAAATESERDAAELGIDPMLLARADEARENAQTTFRTLSKMKKDSHPYPRDAKNYTAIAIEHLSAEIEVLEATFQAQLKKTHGTATDDHQVDIFAQLCLNSQKKDSRIKEAYALYNNIFRSLAQEHHNLSLNIHEEFSRTLTPFLKSHYYLIHAPFSRIGMAQSKRALQLYRQILQEGKLVERLEKMSKELRT